MDVAKKYRGKLESVALSMIQDKLGGDEEIDLSKLYIACYDVPDDILNSCKEKILSLRKFEDIEVNMTGCSVSVHCGPGTIGIIYMAK